MKQWAEVELPPGQFLGSTGVQCEWECQRLRWWLLIDEAVGRGGAATRTVPWLHRRSVWVRMSAVEVMTVDRWSSGPRWSCHQDRSLAPLAFRRLRWWLLIDEAVGRGGAATRTVPWLHWRSDINARRTWHWRPALPGLGQKGIIL